MLKHMAFYNTSRRSLITVQDNTMLKQDLHYLSLNCCLITVQDNTMLKHIKKSKISN